MKINNGLSNFRLGKFNLILKSNNTIPNKILTDINRDKVWKKGERIYQNLKTTYKNNWALLNMLSSDLWNNNYEIENKKISEENNKALMEFSKKEENKLYLYISLYFSRKLEISIENKVLAYLSQIWAWLELDYFGSKTNEWDLIEIIIIENWENISKNIITINNILNINKTLTNLIEPWSNKRIKIKILMYNISRPWVILDFETIKKLSNVDELIIWVSE